jgi:outer membrane receptor for ferrienterochelin and colicin
MKVIPLILGLILGHPAWAQENTAEEADLAFELGIEDYQRGKYRQALVHLLRSNRLARNKNVVFNIARCYENLERYEDAYQRYTDYVDLEGDPEARQDGLTALSRIAEKVALVEVVTDPPEATIYVTRKDLGARGISPRILALRPGTVEVIVTLDGYQGATMPTVAALGTTERVELTLVQLLGEVEVFGDQPGVGVYLEDATTPLSRTPATLNLPPGQHLIRLELPGYIPRTELVTVRLDGATKLETTLERLTGRVVVSASEVGALIEVDGEAAGFSPTVVDLPVGTHSIEVSRQGFDTYRVVVDVMSDAPIPLDIKLKRTGLLGVTVTTATKSAQTTRRAPAVITVIRREDIHARGYRSVAEVLRTVPGFYDVYDLATHNIGVRGVSGGARASGNVIKLMIDGQPVPYRPTTGNFYGEELVPIDAIQRIEIIRGPASALYGADAFLGVVNVITRQDGGSAAIGHVGWVQDRFAHGGGITLQGSVDTISAFVAVQAVRTDRTGLFVADTSPELNSSSEPLTERGNTQNDTAKPESILGRVSVGDPKEGTGKWSAWTSVQRLNAKYEFFDYEPLTHQSRARLQNRTLKLGWDRSPSETTGLHAHFAWVDSKPVPGDQIGLGRDDKVLLRNVGAKGQEAAIEARGKFAGRVQTIAGVDYSRITHLTPSYDEMLLADVLDTDGQKLRDAGTVIPGAGHNEENVLRNIGIFGQGIVDITRWMSVAVGLRLDQPNIYAAALSPRAGLVIAPLKAPWSAKALFSTSFKAPSADQLFGKPIGPFDVLGNQELSAQFARNFELAGTYGLEGVGEVEANAFYTQIIDRVEYLQHDLNLQAENAVDEDIVGAEFTTRLAPVPWFSFQLGTGVAAVTYQRVDEEQRTLLSIEEIPTSFPVLQVHAVTEFRVPSLDLRMAPEVSVVTARNASQSNRLQNISQYHLPGYAMLSASVSMPTLHLHPDYGTVLSLRATDLLNSAAAEPGFNGIDYPALGRRAWLNITQEF